MDTMPINVDKIMAVPPALTEQHEVAETGQIMQIKQHGSLLNQNAALRALSILRT